MIHLFLITAVAFAATDFEKLSQRLIETRAEVEETHSKVEATRETLKAERVNQASQVAELEASIAKEELRTKQLEKQIVELKQKRSVGSNELSQRILAQIEKVRASVAGSLPFKRKERLAELDGLKLKLEKGDLGPERVFAMLWSFLEDEKRMRSDSVKSKQVIEVEGTTRLTEVLRLGMVSMYFKDANSRLGLAMREGGDWVFKYSDDSDKSKMIAHAFMNFDKQVKVGFFELPNQMNSLKEQK